MTDYLYEKDRKYKPKMVKKILKAMRGKFYAVPSDKKGYAEWLDSMKKPKGGRNKL